MKPHTKVYLKHFGYTVADYIPCELCCQKSVDIHHINGRGKGKDEISNLMALCRECHCKAHAHLISKEYLTERHAANLESF